MATITLKGNPIETCGSLPAIGSAAPDFALVTTDLATLSLKDLAGKRVILNIFPSVDTPTCATSVRRFNKDATALKNVAVINVSKDLPFAHKRFCGAEGIDKVQSVSDFRDTEFGIRYGLNITTGPIAGLMSRAIVILDEKGKVIYNEQVGEIANEPNYAQALTVLA